MGTKHGPDVDDVVVDRLTRGITVDGATTAELVAATAILTERGLTAREIGRKLGRHWRSVERYRALATRPPRAERLAANRAAISARIDGRPLVVHVAEPRHPRERVAGELAYVEVGRCPGCKMAWRTNLTNDEIKKHGPADKPCRGSGRPPLARAVLLKTLYRPGEEWAKVKT